MASKKEIKVLARYIHKDKVTGKPNGKVSYLIQSADGKSQYCTTLIEGSASACSCTGNEKYHRVCKHMKSAEEREWARYRAEVAKKLAAQYMTVEAVEQMAEQLVSEQDVRKAAQDNVSPKIVDISTRGTLNGNRGFELMRAV